MSELIQIQGLDRLLNRTQSRRFIRFSKQERLFRAWPRY